MKHLHILTYHISKRYAVVSSSKPNASIESLVRILSNTSNPNKNELIQTAFKIYDNTTYPQRNASLLNILLKIMLKMNAPHQILVIWKDILHTEHISHPLVLQCLIQLDSKHFDIDKCVDTLQHITTIDPSSFPDIAKLIQRTESLTHLNRIHQKVASIDSIAIKKAFIISYSKHSHDTSSSLRIFNSIDDKLKDCGTVSGMMAAFINNNMYSDALDLYEQFNLMTYINDKSNVLALKACTKSNKFNKGKRIHARINMVDKPQSIQLLNSLLSFYNHFGDINTAFNIFNSIYATKRDTVTINIMMTALINNSDYAKALNIYDSFDGVKNNISHALAIKACIRSNNSAKKEKIQRYITGNAHHITDIQPLNMLIDQYGDAGDVDDALKLFDSIPHHKKTKFTLGAMMKALVHNGRSAHALSLYNTHEHLHNTVSHTLALKACTNTKDWDRGTSIHAQVGKNNNISIKTALIDFYGHFGDVKKAKQLFDSIHKTQKTAITVGAMMNVLLSNNMNKETLRLYDRYTAVQDTVSHILAIKACMQMDDWTTGNGIIEALQPINHDSLQLKRCLIQFYSHFKQMKEAIQVFESIEYKQRNAVSVNALMSAYVHNGCADDKVLDIYDKYAACGVVDDASHVIAIKSCINVGDTEKAKRIIATIPVSHVRRSVQLQNALIDCHGHIGNIEAAVDIFESMKQNKDAVSVNSLMSVYASQKDYAQVLRIYDQYHSLCNDRSHVLALNACTNTGNKSLGESIITSHSLNKAANNLHIVNALVHFYGHFGDIQNAWSVFNALEDSKKDIVSINTMMTVLIHNHLNEDALSLYHECASLGLQNDITCVMALKACANSGDIASGKMIHSTVQNTDNLQVKTSLIHFYGTCEDSATVFEIFNSIKTDELNIVAVNALMQAYCDCHLDVECIELFQTLRTLHHKLVADHITYAIALKACTQATSYHIGQQIHETLRNDAELQWMLNETEIQTNLIHLFGKCGMMSVCQQLFEDSKQKNCSEIWNAMINAFGRNGDMKSAMHYFNTMKQEIGIAVDRKVYISLLNACSHSGDVKQAQNIWRHEIEDEHIKYDCFVVTAVVDCFARSGYLKEAKAMIDEYERNSTHRHSSMWNSLMRACKTYSNSSDDNANIATQIYHAFETRFGENN
eukprot:255674_1